VEHFSQSRAEVDATFSRAGLSDRLRWPVAGHAIEI
jgi:hypothetical protein